MSHRSQSGMLLIAALLFAITLFALTSAILTTGVAAQSEKRYVLASQKAAEAAESAVHLTLARLRSPGSPWIPDTGLDLGYTIGGSGKRATRLAINIMPGALDGADNDLDGTVDEEDEKDLYELVATGRHDNVGRALRVTLQFIEADLAFTAPIMIGDPEAAGQFDGNAHLITAKHHDIYGQPVANGNTDSAIGVAGDPDLMTPQLPNKSRTTIVGDPPVTEIPMPDLAPWVKKGNRHADIRLAETLAGDTPHRPDPDIEGHWGTINDPRLIVGTGNVEVASSEKGAGVMVIDGDLTISGGFEWTGAILVTGKVTFAGGGKGTRLIGGAILSGSRVDGEIDFNITGTVDVLYSPEAILRMMGSAFGRKFDALKWRSARVGEETAP